MNRRGLILFVAILIAGCGSQNSPSKKATHFGWYLMIPPDTPAPYDSSLWQSKVSIAHWTIVDLFDSRAVCKEALVNTIRKAHRKEQTDDASVRVADHLKFLAIKNNAVCVANDDPRLKSKWFSIALAPEMVRVIS
jgi:hypothetical protein